MRTRWIEIDGEVMARIQEQAEPFVDTPNDALRQLLGLGPALERTCSPLPASHLPSARSRAGFGQLMPMTEFELPLLKALAESGGSGYRPEVKRRVGEMLAERLTPLDREPLNSGEIRWENRLGFVRRRLIERGHLRANSPRGLWQLTEAGAAELSRREAAEHERSAAQ